MDLNDRFGDCVVACADHSFQAIHSQLVGPYTNWSEATIVNYFKSQNPDFNPATDAGDNGMVVQVFLELLRKQGLIVAFAQVDHTNTEEVKAACYLFLALMAGATLTQANIDQFDKGEPWDFDAKGEAIGGHAFPLVGYDASDLYAVTWAALQQTTQAFLGSAIDELWVPFTPDHFANPTFRASIDQDKLIADFSAMTGAPPVIPPAPPTPVPPIPVDPTTLYRQEATAWAARRHVGVNGIFAAQTRKWLQETTPEATFDPAVPPIEVR
jgi:hypothetical protein